ncbi:or membrane protein [Corynebacterium kutscheri]|uniref:Or membrane protein n=1 Tax=Corynebacterium kutscheri TaxID=35755 RepID=A0A0F6R1C5_9CORY|nr:hypothetical protein [Corynebacterium kutscheri]AKE40928.1 hypothetical protein UL82_03605 [Corynebacterium kutscheri]VEH06745.1 or membrane protein [Corynebacterium kutscheri]VEH09227.1 or membrane protein [Corynebacterium kutscheri]VEH79313.1 or membrane protein [Corynebacterium kutscheri]
MSIKVRLSASALLCSKATATCIIFVTLTTVVLGVLLYARIESTGTLHKLYTIAMVAPIVGILVAVLSLIIGWIKGRRSLAVINNQVCISHSGISFPLAELAAIAIFSDNGSSFVTFIPQHLVTENVVGLKDYTIEFSRGISPRPFELADQISALAPEVRINKIGSLHRG